MPKPPVCGLWMSSQSYRTHKNSIFHPKKGYKAWMTSCAHFALVKVVMQVVVCAQLGVNYAIKTDDHVVYFKSFDI
jgi:hypothetical protein